MDAIHPKIFSDLLLLSPCLFQISFTPSCYQIPQLICLPSSAEPSFTTVQNK